MTVEQLVSALAGSGIPNVTEIEVLETTLYASRVATAGVTSPVVRTTRSASLKYSISGGTNMIGELTIQAGVVLGIKPFVGAAYVHVRPVVDLIEKGV